MSEPDPGPDQQIVAKEGARQLLFMDATRAHFHSPQTEVIYVNPPAERAREGQCWQLLKSMYGTRRAGHNWEVFYSGVLTDKLGFVRGVACPCLFYHPVSRIRCWVHGDDFVFLGTGPSLAVVAAAISVHIAMKTTGEIKSESAEVRCLNRIIRYDATADTLEWECDPRHAELICASMGLSGRSNAVTTPGVSLPLPDVAKDRALSVADCTLYRSVTMRASYMAQDRPELLFAVKEAARQMQSPTVSSMEKLKRLARYLVHHPRMVQVFRRQQAQETVVQLTDSDHAGCKVTRRSTSAGMSLHGQHFLCAFSTTQKPIATSSGESEFYGMFKSGSRLVGLMQMALDFGMLRRGVLRPDATAGMGMANRLGIGKVRHLHTQSLWLQRQVADKRFVITKINGPDNAADLPTKHVDGPTMLKHLETAGFEPRMGKSKLAIDTSVDAYRLSRRQRKHKL